MTAWLVYDIWEWNLPRYKAELRQATLLTGLTLQSALLMARLALLHHEAACSLGTRARSKRVREASWSMGLGFTSKHCPVSSSAIWRLVRKLKGLTSTISMVIIIFASDLSRPCSYRCYVPQSSQLLWGIDHGYRYVPAPPIVKARYYHRRISIRETRLVYEISRFCL